MRYDMPARLLAMPWQFSRQCQQHVNAQQQITTNNNKQLLSHSAQEIIPADVPLCPTHGDFLLGSVYQWKPKVDCYYREFVLAHTTSSCNSLPQLTTLARPPHINNHTLRARVSHIMFA